MNMRRAQNVNKGFPREAGWWTVYAKLPATRTMGTSYGEWDVDMVPQGERVSDYASKNYELPMKEPGYNNYSFEVSGDDIAELYEYYKNRVVGYAVFEVDGFTECYDAHLYKDGEEPFTYGISVYIRSGFAYEGTAKIHLNSTGEGGLKSADITASGNWYMGVL